jgi:hypothetical protein
MSRSRAMTTIAADINNDPGLGLRATVTRSWSNTDTKIAGTRLRRQGKGCNGYLLVVTLVRTGEVVCEVDTSKRYEYASEAEEWLAKWRSYDRQYHRAGPLGVYHVPGEPTKKPKERRP